MTIVSIGGGKSLEATAAASFARILVIRPGMLARVNSAYRSDAEQAVLRHAWEVDHSKPYASKPGVSKHNHGTALDIDSDPANADHQWMVDHGREYGWVRPDGWQKASVPEPWHFEYHPELDQHAHTTIPRKKAKMLHFYVKDSTTSNGVRYFILMPDGRLCAYTSGDSAFPNGIAANIGNAVLTDEALIKALQKQLRESGPVTATATIDPAAIKAAMPTAAQIAALVPDSDSIVTKIVTAIKGLSWSTK